MGFMKATGTVRLRTITLVAASVAVAALLAFSAAPRANAAAGADTWSTNAGAPDTVGWRSVAWSPSAGVFVAVGPSALMTSSDGITWTARTVPTATWTSVAWSPELGLFAAVGNTGTLAITSPDGTNWTSRTVTGGKPSASVVWSSGRHQFVAAAVAGGSMTSSDGITWTVGADSTRPNLTHGLAWSPSLALYVAVSNNGAYTSPDGTTWTLGTSLPASGWRSVAWSPTLNLFVATGISGISDVATSPDGIIWTATPTAVTVTLSAVTWSPDQAEFVAVGHGSVLSSTDGVTWNTITDPEVGNTWVSVVWAPTLTRYVAVSSDGTSRTMTGIVPTPPGPSPTASLPALASTGASTMAIPVGMGLVLLGGLVVAASVVFRRSTGRHRRESGSKLS